ncbi:MAG: hypothetical protein HUU29_10235 [Planctomycetaceae bacterium]|nr:hypothetical protein [Planctomycetaceae bacterium]
MSKRVVLLFGVEHAAFARRCAQGANVVGVVFERRSLQVRMNMLTTRLRRLGTWTVLGQLGHRVYRRLLRGCIRGSEETGKGTFPEALMVGDINGDEVVAFLRKHQPDAVAVYGTSLLRKPLLEALPKDNYNIHTGLTQYYRGVCSSFWALYEDHPERLGVTIHRLSPGIDTGEIVLMAQPPGNMV